MKHTVHESVYASVLTASLSLLDVFRKYLHLFTCDWIATHVLDCHELAKAGYY